MLKKTSSSNFGSTIPELTGVIDKYGCKFSDKPGYVLVGQFNSKTRGPLMGILCVADNEFHAHLLRREINKCGDCDVERTEYHSAPTFSIREYKQKVAEAKAKAQLTK